MAQPAVANDIMSRTVITCTSRDSLAEARKRMKENNIRHIPVVDDLTGCFEGVLTQKELLKQAFDIANKFGMADLDHQESKRKVRDFMCADARTIAPDTSLREAGEYFVASKYGCLPVLEGKKVVGILTSADFVKLSIRLLEAGKDA